MSLIEDLRALNRDPNDPRDVAEAIALLALDPAGRMKLIQEWEQITVRTFPPTMREQLLGERAGPV